MTQAQIDAYADASGDHNPIHVNPEAARAVGLPGTIAHGMLSMGFLGQFLTNWITTQPSGGWIARLRVRFQGMVFAEDTLTCRGALTAHEDNHRKPRRLDRQPARRAAHHRGCGGRARPGVGQRLTAEDAKDAEVRREGSRDQAERRGRGDTHGGRRG